MGGRRIAALASALAVATGLLGSSTVAGGAAPAPHLQADLARLRVQVLDALGGSTAQVTALRVDIGGLGIIASNSTTALRPASNNKLLVAEAALQRLGPKYRYVTPVYSSAPIRHGVIHGWLGIRASGDPTLSDASLTAMADALRRLGLRRVTGNLVLNASCFDIEDAAPGWQPGFVPNDIGPISGFAVGQNAWRTDPHFIAHPDMANLVLWRSALEAAGIKIDGENYVKRFHVSHRPLLVYRSGPLSAVVATMLTYSDNFYAEMLLDKLGRVTSGLGDRTNGLAAVFAEARSLHVRLVRDVDGSGLSYDDAESPNVLVDWLEATMRTRSGDTLKAGLPIACETGTLQYRLCRPGTTGRVEAKTGSLTGVDTLSGFTTTAVGQPVVFSILLSGDSNDATAIDHIDQAVAVIATTSY
jgi:D-alanyl-D-alanine carboxypeptidase/D-alanyl-D-alanine-endopeptidase (penicillin-binding protein 4)